MSISFWADGGCRLSVQADSHPKSSGLVLGRRPLGAVLNSSNELGELLQWLCHDDSTINIVLDIIIIIKKVLLLEQNVRQSFLLPNLQFLGTWHEENVHRLEYIHHINIWRQKQQH